jgi:hypothetical protein
MTETIVLSEELQNKIIERIRKKGPANVYWDRNDQISESQIIKALNSGDEYPLNDLENTIDEINDFWYELRFDHLKNILEYFKQELLDELYPNEDEDFEIDFKELTGDLRDQFDDHIQVNTNLKQISSEIDIRLELFSNYDCINSHWFESENGYEYTESYFGDVINQLKLNPQKVKSMLVKRGVKCHGNWPRKSDANRLIEYDAFWQEIENRSCGANLLTIVAKIDGYEFLANYNKDKTTVIIPKGNYVGFFSSFQGGGSTIEAPLLRDLKIEINKNLDASGFLKWGLFVDHGTYSINNVYGVTRQFWGNEMKIQPQD